MSEFLDRKVRTFFKHLDTNNDGVISLKDYVELAERRAEAEKLDAAEREKMKEIFAELWRKDMKSANSDDNGLLTASILVESVKQQRNDPEFKAAYMAVCHQVFCCWNTNGDGFLTEDEYATAFAQMGFPDPSVSHRVFQSIDVNQDGKLTWEEFGNAIFENLTSEDENSPYTLVWGPLVE